MTEINEGTVLLVETNDDQREAFEERLVCESYGVVAVASASEGVAILEGEHDGEVDGVITNTMWGGLPEAAEAAGARLILLSASDEKLAEAEERGILSFDKDDVSARLISMGEIARIAVTRVEID